jgi:transcriptional regulator with XRE-family HTH domain
MAAARRLLPFTRMNTEESMGERITRQAEVKNLNQSQIAKLLHVSRMSVSQWFRNISEPKPKHLVALAELLFDGDVHYLVHGAEREPDGGFPSAPKPGAVPSGFVPPARRRRKV